MKITEELHALKNAIKLENTTNIDYQQLFHQYSNEYSNLKIDNNIENQN